MACYAVTWYNKHVMRNRGQGKPFERGNTPVWKDKACGMNHAGCEKCHPGWGTSKGRKGVPPKPIDEYLWPKNQQSGRTARIKRKLIGKGILKERCASCGLGARWRNEPLVLQLNHIDGDSANWRPENLEILCPNCHTQTSTYAGRNARKV